MYRPLGHLYGNINTFVRLFEITVVEYEIHPVNMAAFELRKVPARILECFGRQVQRSAGIIAGDIGMAGSLHEQLGIAIRRDSIDKLTPDREEMVVRFLFVFVRSRCQQGPVQVFIVPLLSRKGCKMVEYRCWAFFNSDIVPSVNSAWA